MIPKFITRDARRPAADDLRRRPAVARFHLHRQHRPRQPAGRRRAGRRGATINVACGEQFNLLELVAGINKALGTSIEPIFAPARAGDVRDSLADITLARKLLKYEPIVDFEEGLRRARSTTTELMSTTELATEDTEITESEEIDQIARFTHVELCRPLVISVAKLRSELAMLPCPARSLLWPRTTRSRICPALVDEILRVLPEAEHPRRRRQLARRHRPLVR